MNYQIVATLGPTTNGEDVWKMLLGTPGLLFCRSRRLQDSGRKSK